MATTNQVNLQMEKVRQAERVSFKKAMRQDLEGLRDLFYEWAANANSMKLKRADPRAECFADGCNRMAAKCAQEVQNFIVHHYHRVRDMMDRR